jgi:phospholipase/carboxylesterase
MAASSEKFIYEKAADRLQSGSLRPALILLHGRGTDEHDLIGLAPSFDPRFLVYSLRAPFRYPFGGYMWFGADDLEHWDSDQLQASLDFCLKFSEHIIHIDGVDPSKIFLFGFSLGAMTALGLASLREKHFAGVVAHSGFYTANERLPQKFGPQSPPVFLAHGIYDPVIPVILGRSTFKFLQEHDVPVSYREYPIEHTIGEESLQDAAHWLQQQLDQTTFVSQEHHA